jgi:hypothetical protein
MESTKTIPHYEEWKKTQAIEIHVQIEAGDGQVLDTTFFSLDELESYWRKMERAIEAQLREDYDYMVEDALEEEE